LRLLEHERKLRETEELERRVEELTEIVEQMERRQKRMGLEDKVKKLEKAVQGNTESFELSDGIQYRYDPDKTFSTMFSHFMNCLRADYHHEERPGPPESLVAVSKAKNRRRALNQTMKGSSFLAYEVEPLIEEGQFVPKKLTTAGPVG